MKYRRTPQFHEDYEELSRSVPEIYDLLDENFPLLDRALNGDSDLYRHFRIKKMQGYSDIWEGHLKNNICFTFHYENKYQSEKVCVFRRIGTHDIYNSP